MKIIISVVGDAKHEVLSDSFIDETTLLHYIAHGKWVDVEGQDEAVPENEREKTIDVVQKFAYNELDKENDFKKKSFLLASKAMMKAAKKNLKKQGKSEDEIKTYVEEFTKFVDKCIKEDWEELQFYVNPDDFDYENSYIIIQKGTDFYFLKDCCKEEKC